MAIRRLNRKESSTITASSALTSPVDVVKELIENSCDALKETQNAQVYVELDSNTGGFLHILVRDNGAGVPKADRTLMCCNCTTSKLSTMADLEQGVSTFGFRGEALYLMSQLADSMEVTTRTRDDEICASWSVNHSGLPASVANNLAGPVGTTVKVGGLFKDRPVRMRVHKGREAKLIAKVTDLLFAYALAHRDIRFQLKVVEIAANGNIRSSGKGAIYPSKIPRSKLMGNVLGLRSRNTIFEVAAPLGDDARLHALLPMSRAQDETIKKGVKVMVVNGRPLDLKLPLGRRVSRLVNSIYSDALLLPPPAWYIDLTIPLDKVDVNIEPSKSDLMVAGEDALMAYLAETLESTVCEHHEITPVTGPLPGFISAAEALKRDENEPEEATEPESHGLDVLTYVPAPADHPADDHLFVQDFSDEESSTQLFSGQAVFNSSGSVEERTKPPSKQREIVSQTQSVLPIVSRPPLITDMTQHTLGLEMEATFQPSSHQVLVALQEIRWSKRTGNPSSFLQEGVAALRARAQD